MDTSYERYDEHFRIVMVRDRVIRDRGKARALVKPVRASRCSRATQKKLSEDGKSASRRDATRRARRPTPGALLFRSRVAIADPH